MFQFAKNPGEVSKKCAKGSYTFDYVYTIDSFLPDAGIYLDTFVINNFFRFWGHKFIYDY